MGVVAERVSGSLVEALEYAGKSQRLQELGGFSRLPAAQESPVVKVGSGEVWKRRQLKKVWGRL